MKKIISVAIVLTMLCSLLAFNVSAAADVQFSMNTVQAKHSETVVIDVNLDVNPGLWSTYFEVLYNPAYFDLVSVENGDVVAEANYIEVPVTDSGSHLYFSDSSTFENNTKTGRIFSLTFKVLKTAPVGEHIIDINFPDNGEGWFLQVVKDDKGEVDSVSLVPELTKKGVIVVGDASSNVGGDTEKGESNETFLPPASPDRDPAETTKAPEKVESGKTEETSGKAEETKKPVETILGEPVKPAETEAGKTYESEYVTDDEGETVLNENKDPELIFREVIEKDKAPENLNTIILVVSVCAVFAAGIIVAIVFVNNKKNKQ